MRKVLAEGLREWRGIYEQLIREGQSKGVMRADLDPLNAANIVCDLWSGAMQRGQIEKSIAPLRGASVFIRQYLVV